MNAIPTEKTPEEMKALIEEVLDVPVTMDGATIIFRVEAVDVEWDTNIKAVLIADETKLNVLAMFGMTMGLLIQIQQVKGVAFLAILEVREEPIASIILLLEGGKLLTIIHASEADTKEFMDKHQIQIVRTLWKGPAEATSIQTSFFAKFLG